MHLLVAAGLAAALGAEREISEQPAGFRTHLLVGLGSALFAVISVYGFQGVAGLGPPQEVRVDISRVASQIVVGIGFLGGGAILKYGANVRGLTTAASLWVTAAVGTAAGIGMLALAAATAAIALLALTLLRPLRALIRRAAIGHQEFVLQADPGVRIDGILTEVAAAGVRLRNMRVLQEGGLLVINLQVKVPRGAQTAGLIEQLKRNEHIHDVEWSA